MAKQAAYTTVVSHRSGETEEPSSPTWRGRERRADQTGSLCRSDRLAKYNQLLRIEEDLEEEAIYYGPSSGRQLVRPRARGRVRLRPQWPR